jgi:hypothetical protein
MRRAYHRVAEHAMKPVVDGKEMREAFLHVGLERCVALAVVAGGFDAVPDRVRGIAPP